VVRHDGKEIVAVGTKDGKVVLLDSASLGGSDHATAAYVSKPLVNAGGGVSAALATWSQTDAGQGGAAAPAGVGASWILVPIAGRPAAAGGANGAATNGAVVALKLGGAGSTLSLEPAWASGDLVGAGTPIVVNGVVFTIGTGVPAAATGRAGAASLHAYDGASGKRLWTSEKAMTGPASPGSMWTGLGQIYVGGRDGTVHAFGFNDERRATTGN
jgi:hypothetical protein